MFPELPVATEAGIDLSHTAAPDGSFEGVRTQLIARVEDGGSLMFTPELSLAALQTMKSEFGAYIYGRYGFADAFHPQSLWVNPDIVGIDQGIVLLSAENLRTGQVWNWFNRHPDIRRAMNRIFEPDLRTS